MNTETASRRSLGRRSSRDPVRLTALIYLREALIAEKYEECAGIISIAVEFGATENDINSLLEDIRRRPV